MKILTLADSIFEDKPGGSKVVARELARRLAEKGHEITFLVPKVKLDTPDDESLNGYRVSRYAFSSRRDLIRQAARRFQQLQEQDRFDVIHVHFAYAGLGVLRNPASREIPVLRHFYGSWSMESRVERANGLGKLPLLRRVEKMSRLIYLALECTAKEKVERDSLKRSQVVVPLSSYSQEQLRSHYAVPQERIRMIPGGVDRQRFRPAQYRKIVRADLDLPPDRPMLLTVRRLVPRMGLENLILAMPEVITAHPEILLLIGGGGPLRESLQNLVEQHGLSSHVKLLGFIPEDILPTYYQAADGFVLPTQALEGFGLIMLEAMACGTPVLGTPVGAIPEILGSLGDQFLFKDCSSQAIARGICWFLSSHVGDETLRCRCCELVTERYSWDSITNQVEQILYQMVVDRL